MEKKGKERRKGKIKKKKRKNSECVSAAMPKPRKA